MTDTKENSTTKSTENIPQPNQTEKQNNSEQHDSTPSPETEPEPKPQLEKYRHISYFKRFLSLLPSQFESEDSNKLAIIYFSLCGLDLLNAIPSVFPNKTEVQSHIDWIYAHSITTESYFGFRGSLVYQHCGNERYDPINLASTCFALQILLLLGDDLARVNRVKLMRYLKLCQNEEGSFAPFVELESGKKLGDVDVRYCMLAALLRKLIKWEEYLEERKLKHTDDDSNDVFDIDIDSLTRYIKSLKSFDGGLAQASMLESHAGLTYCGLCALSMINQLHPEEWQDTIDFLVHRQLYYNSYNQTELRDNEYAELEDNGGFDGRVNKYADTCYAFWCCASLDLLGGLDLVHGDAVLGYLLEQTQHPYMGGFLKTNDDDMPDPLHSFLGLCVCCFFGKKEYGCDGLDKVDSGFVLSKKAVEHWKAIKFVD
ncbi:unnamed protein product [Ambrosiozyma monospora]|uniref:Unnamed protein product n=1 Tax=Ambrosiozyma monospora TaxID=43982 RepID=A0ACB5T8S1_AMBMO|nr:unnamed protein product [Ambrosiozyma monospora]